MITVLQRKNQDEAQLRRYLLGQAPAEEQRMVEQHLLEDQDYFDLLLRCEEELTDEYARGELAGPDKERFESHFLSTPKRIESLEFAKNLNRYRSEHAQPYPVIPRLSNRRLALMEVALVAAVIVLVATAVLMFRTTVRLQEQVSQNRAQLSLTEQREYMFTQGLEQQRQQLERLSEELAKLPSSIHQDDSDLVSLVLTPGQGRSEDTTATASLFPGIRRLRLALKIDGTSYMSYRADLETVEGNIVWSRDDLAAPKTSHSRAVEVILPAALLHRSDYLVMLSGTTPTGISEKIGTYHFSTMRK